MKNEILAALTTGVVLSGFYLWEKAEKKGALPSPVTISAASTANTNVLGDLNMCKKALLARRTVLGSENDSRHMQRLADTYEMDLFSSPAMRRTARHRQTLHDHLTGNEPRHPVYMKLLLARIGSALVHE